MGEALFKNKKLGDIVHLRYGKGLPKRDRLAGIFPVYGSGGVVDSHNAAIVKGPGIIVGRKGSIGTIYYEKKDFYPIDTVYFVEVKNREMNIYYLSKLMSQMGLENLNTDAAVPGLNRDVALSQEVLVPPYTIQNKIAVILSAYDDLIENNLRRIKILEKMAQNLYREWFVNFRFPGHENARFVDSPLGRIPDGWEVTLLENACERITDGAHRSPQTTFQGYPMASVKDMHDWGINIETCRKISEGNFLELTRTDCVMRKGDVLIAKDGSYLKHCIEVEKDFEIALLSSIAILRPNKKTASTFLLMTLKDENVKNRMKGYVSGAALPRIILKEFRKFPIILPPSNMQNEFVSIVRPLQGLCWRLLEKNNTLRQTRDLLLPKLISGEVDVSGLDISVPEEAAI